MDLDSFISQIEGTKPTAKKVSSGIDVDTILKDFGVKIDVVEPVKQKASTNTGEPRPPISGISKEASDEINSQRALKGGENPRRALPTTNISEAAYEADKAGKEMFSSGIEDLSTGHPYKGIAKTALGAFMRVGSPMSGIVEGGIGTPLTDITGNKGIGDRASIIAGAAVPIVPGAGAISKAAAHVPVIKSLSNYTKNKSFKDLVEAIGPENIPMVVREMKANPRLGPADLSPKVLQDTQSLFASDGQHINYLKNVSDARMATRKDAIEAAYDASAGPSVELSKKMTDLANAAKKVGEDKINPLIKSAKPINTSNTVAEIDKILKPGVMAKVTSDSELPLNAVKKELNDVRGFLANKTEVRTDPEDLHKFQSRLRVTAENLLKSTDGQSKNLGNQLLTVRKNLIDDIEKSAPGYKEALNAYREEKHIAGAFKEGHDKIFTSSKNIENDPSFVKKWFDGLTDYEKQAAKEGARTAIYTQMGVAKNPALAGESIARSDFNKAKMEILFGKEETDKLLKSLADERKIADTHNKVIENSQTAMRMASKDKWKVPTPTEAGKQLLPLAVMEGSNMLAGGIGGVGTALYTGARVANAAKDAAKLKVFRENQAQYAKLALPTEGPSRDQLIKQLEAVMPQPKMTMLNKVKAALPASNP